jgi:23S rRNA (uridine2552-2'-O)-methyltransferase
VAQPRKLHDEYFLRAKKEGYVARSAYKLLEINANKRIVRRGDCVLDLGCSPGSWLQVLEKIIGREGRAVGIDLQPTKAVLGPTVRWLVGDAFKADPDALLDAAGLGRTGGDAPAEDPAWNTGTSDGNAGKVWLFDAVLSDMAPSTTGHGDALLSARLCDSVLDLCPHVLRPGGRLLMKVLEGEASPELIKRTRRYFESAGTTKPKASRDVSREMFIWGIGYRPTRVA